MAVISNEPQYNAVYTERLPLGTGVPQQAQTSGYEQSYAMPDGVYSTPGQMPGYPTAATIWPRVVRVSCKVGEGNTLLCKGVDVNLVDTGRGEYLYTQPVIETVKISMEKPSEKIVVIDSCKKEPEMSVVKPKPKVAHKPVVCK